MYVTRAHVFPEVFLYLLYFLKVFYETRLQKKCDRALKMLLMHQISKQFQMQQTPKSFQRNKYLNPSKSTKSLDHSLIISIFGLFKFVIFQDSAKSMYEIFRRFAAFSKTAKKQDNGSMLLALIHVILPPKTQSKN